MAGEAHFEFYKAWPAPEGETPFDGPPQWRWRLRATNGEVVASGEGFVDKGGVLDGIQAVVGAVLHTFEDPADLEDFARDDDGAVGWEDVRVEEVSGP